MLPLLAAGAIAGGLSIAGSLAGGTGPDSNLYQPSQGRIRKYEKWPVKAWKAYRRGGLNDPELSYLGFGPNWRNTAENKMRDATKGEEIASEQRISDISRGYGGPGANSGQFVNNLMRLRSGRQASIDAAMRDLELEDYAAKERQFYQNQEQMRSWYGTLTGQSNAAESAAYDSAYNQWAARKQQYAAAAKTIGGVVSSMAH
jgi:hypothetical protein